MDQKSLQKFEVNAEERTIVFSCCSDYPYTRTDEQTGIQYDQILVINEDSVDMTRLNTGNAPILWNHNTDENLGIVQKAWILDNKVYVQCKFSKNSEFADRIWKDILDSVIKNISIGYEILSYKDVQQNGKNIRYVDKFLVYQLTVCSCAADPTVGFRSLTTKNKDKFMKKELDKKQCGQDLEKKQVEVQVEKQEQKEVVEQPQKEQVQEVKEQIKDEEKEALKAQNEALKAEIEKMKAEKEEIKEEVVEQVEEEKPLDDSTRQQIEKIAQDFDVEKEEVQRAIQDKLTVREFKQKIKSLNFNVKNKETKIMDSKREFESYLQARNYEKPFTLRDFTGFGGKTGENGESLIGTQTIDYVAALEKKMGVKGFKTLSNLHYNISIPVQTGRNTIYQTADLRTAASESNPEFTQKALTPVKLSGNTVIGTELIVQSNTDIVGFVIDSLTKEIAYKLEDFILGKVVAANPTQINYANLGAITWDDILAFEAAVGAYALNDLQFVGSPSARAALKGIPKASNYPQFLCMDNEVNGYAFNVSGCVSNDNIYFGDFSKMVVGFFGEGLDILVNPYKYSTEGMIEVTASLCVDAVVTQPDAFAIGKVQSGSSDSSESSASL